MYGNWFSYRKVSNYVLIISTYMWSVFLIANIEMDVQAKRKRARTPTPGEYLGVRGMLVSLFQLDPAVIMDINIYP